MDGNLIYMDDCLRDTRQELEICSRGKMSKRYLLFF